MNERTGLLRPNTFAQRPTLGLTSMCVWETEPTIFPSSRTTQTSLGLSVTSACRGTSSSFKYWAITVGFVLHLKCILFTSLLIHQCTCFSQGTCFEFDSTSVASPKSSGPPLWETWSVSRLRVHWPSASYQQGTEGLHRRV